MQPDGWDNAELLKRPSTQKFQTAFNALTGVKACASTETPRQ